VPLTILNARPDDRFVICEIGTNAPGEIAHLSGIVKPNVAIITNVGSCHLEGLGSIEGIAREKASLLDHIQNGGCAVVHAGGTALQNAIGQKTCPVTTFGVQPEAYGRITHSQVAESGTQFSLSDGSRWSLALLGTHHAINAAAVIAAARFLGVDDERIADGLRSVEPAPGRFAPIRMGERIVYDDSYNANPESMAAAIRTFLAMTSADESRAIILGEMLELGSASESEHEKLGTFLADALKNDHLKISIMLLGPAMSAAATAIGAHLPEANVVWLERADEEAIAKALARAGNAQRILVKGSRRNRLERVIKGLGNESAQ
jgi:UDP-N-acetylmuramyl pentapeptide synthase